jgi:hypothetical protein
LIWQQWIENLALRRVYYLEYNHYQARIDELDLLNNLDDPEDPCQQNRPPFIPHPELRDTVPNVSLYSVLYKLPSVHFATSGASPEIQRQLQTAVEFFDRIVPNQPGYSSSVAAVTILPDVNQVSKAWKKWFDCANKLRRLRFIRKRLQLMQEGQSKNVEVIFQYDRASDEAAGAFQSNFVGIGVEQASRSTEGSGNSSDSRGGIKQRNCSIPRRAQTPIGGLHKLETVDEGSTGDLSSNDDADHTNGVPSESDVQDFMTKHTRSSNSNGADDVGWAHYHRDDITPILDRAGTSIRSNRSIRRRARLTFEKKKDRILTSVGLAEELKLEMFLSDDDIEQMTVYCREYARR